MGVQVERCVGNGRRSDCEMICSGADGQGERKEKEEEGVEMNKGEQKITLGVPRAIQILNTLLPNALEMAILPRPYVI